MTTKENGLSRFALSLAGPSVSVVPAASRTHSPLVSLVVPVVPVVPVAPVDANVPFMPSDRASNSSALTARSSRWQPDTTLRPSWSSSECVRGSSPAACSFPARPRHMKPPSATSLACSPAESLTVEVSTNMESMWAARLPGGQASNEMARSLPSLTEGDNVAGLSSEIQVRLCPLLCAGSSKHVAELSKLSRSW